MHSYAVALERSQKRPCHASNLSKGAITVAVQRDTTAAVMGTSPVGNDLMNKLSIIFITFIILMYIYLIFAILYRSYDYYAEVRYFTQ